MKTTILKFFTLSAAIFAFSTISFGQNSSQASANSSVRIIQPILIEQEADMNFGVLIANTTGYDVTLNTAPGDLRTAPAGVALTGGTTYQDTPSLASFTITGEPNTSFAIALPGSVNLSNGTETMVVDTFSSSLGATSTIDGDGKVTLTSTIDGDGKVTLNVGATLSVGASQASGNYTNTFNVTVNYN